MIRKLCQKRYENPVKNRYESPAFYDLCILHCYESPVRSRAFVTNRYETLHPHTEVSFLLYHSEKENKCLNEISVLM